MNRYRILLVMEQRKMRQLVLLVLSVALLMMSVRIRHERLGWGSYWSLEFVAPWHR